tara:strand:- start:1664 stop:1846 length:183 start_codon:yes stop_codon:yes gene_type:complete
MKNYKEIINTIKQAVEEEMDHAAHWGLEEWTYEKELYVKSIVARELAELYEIRYEEIKEK